MFQKNPTPPSHILTRLLSDPPDFTTFASAAFLLLVPSPSHLQWRPPGGRGDRISSARTSAPPAHAGEGHSLTKLHYKATRQRIWIPNLTHSTLAIASIFLYEVATRNKNACPGTAAIKLRNCCNAKDLSADNKHGIIYVCSVKAWKQLNKTNSTLSIFR